MRPVALRKRGSASVVQPWVALLVALARPATPSAAQAVYGSIAGTVADSSGARAPGASLTVTSLERGTVDKVTSNASGYYINPTTGALELFDAPPASQWSRPPSFPDGGGGLVSTVDDYLAFGRMLLNKGGHGRERILSRPSVETMITDQLTPAQKAASTALVPGYFDSHGWDSACPWSPGASIRPTCRQVRMGRRARHVLVLGSSGGHGDHPADPGRVHLAQSSGGRGPLLDLGLSGDRRLKRDR
jgi:Beta-lactamase